MTVLASAIGMSDVQIVVNATLTVGNYPAPYTIGTENIAVQGGSGSTVLSVLRGQNGTARSSHAAGTAITSGWYSGGGAPEAHHVSHQDGGSDEIDVTGLAGAGVSVLPDPGHVWQADTAVAQGYRITNLHDGDQHVFEATIAGTTVDWASSFNELDPKYAPGARTTGDNFPWRHIGIVGTVAEASLSWLRPFVEVDAAGVVSVNSPALPEDGERMFQLRFALADPGNSWQSETEFANGDRISATVAGSLRVFEVNGGTATTGATEPAWLVATIGQTTSDGGVSWAYRGIVGDTDTGHFIFDVKTDGDADWNLDADQSAGFRFNQSVNGVSVAGAGRTQFTTDGFKVYVGAAKFEVRYDPFTIYVSGLPTSDPHDSEALYTDGVPGTGDPKPLMVSGG